MSRSSVWLRRAEMNKSLLVVLGVVALLAVGFWGYQFMSGEKPSPVVVSADPSSYYCPDCKKAFEVPAGAANTPKQENGKYECPNCKKMTASPGFGPNPRRGQP